MRKTFSPENILNTAKLCFWLAVRYIFMAAVWTCFVLQLSLTAYSFQYAVKYGISHLNPSSPLESIIVATIFGLFGILLSPLTGLMLPYSLIVLGHYYLPIYMPIIYAKYTPALIHKFVNWLSRIGQSFSQFMNGPEGAIIGIVLLLLAVKAIIYLWVYFIVFLLMIAFAPAFISWTFREEIINNIIPFYKDIKRAHSRIRRNHIYKKTYGHCKKHLQSSPPQQLQTIQTTQTNGASSSKPDSYRSRNLYAFDRLAGVDHAIRAIKDALEIPLMYPEKAREYGIKPSKGILFYGPPGTGKTSLARATAEYFGCYFISVKASELVGPYVGSSEAAVKQLFAQARANKPAIIFFDEIDAIARRRDGSHLNRPSDIVLNILLAEMDGFEKDEGVFVIGATNRLDVLDEALLRPGRFDSVIEIPLPDFKARKKLFSIYLEGRPISDEEFLDVFELAKLTEGMSPAQIEAICKKAALTALKREIEESQKGLTKATKDCIPKKGIRMSDLVDAIKEVCSSFKKPHCS
ncbi:ATP-dependent zinc metalloprotease FtsH [Fervidicola ferrireducens]|uniref:ATP-dependent zinc metalloprotease FtsH n=1 Tax=Fervidicola ferrireducens TaxID=520764 RepID=A0A140KZU3_9FIRM|nr:ATP-binding protein [Fervidicola ferrireducens]KXG73818.1 ATP-dependent zinc metalloprotease FtsH [Fervidicola ferrireducens]